MGEPIMNPDPTLVFCECVGHRVPYADCARCEPAEDDGDVSLDDTESGPDIHEGEDDEAGR